MPIIHDELRALSETFTTDLVALVRRAALEAASSALGGRALSAPAQGAQVRAARRQGRPKKAALAAPAAPTTAPKRSTRAAPAAKASVPRKPTAGKRPGAKRSPAELARLGDELLDYIKAYPGVHMEALVTALGSSAVDLRFPVVQLVRAKKVRTEGQKQNMAYFPT